MGNCKEFRTKLKPFSKKMRIGKNGDGRRRRLEVLIWKTLLLLQEAGSSEEVGVRVEVGKRRKVARQGRFTGGGGRAREVGRLDVEEVIRQLHLLSEEDRGWRIGPFTVQSEEDLSGLSDETSGGSANRAAPLIGDSVLTPCG